MKRKFVIMIVAAFMFALLSSHLVAGSWDWSKPYKNPARSVNTLIVVGNYIKPRLMADLIQIETKQPILLLPAKPEGKIFFIPAKDETMVIPLEDLQSFIKYLSPGKIIVLGDRRYVPEKYMARIDPAQTVIKVENEKWDKVASMTSRILNLTYLDRRYKKYEAKIESGELYRPDWANSIDALGMTDSETLNNVEVVDEAIVIENDKNASKSKDGAPQDTKTTSEPKLIDDTKVVPK